MKEKIEQWQKELDKIATKQKEMNQKYNEQTRNLQEKIREGKKIIEIQKNQMIADVVREFYGEVNLENLEQFKNQMKSMVLNSEMLPWENTEQG